jgi:hypothetical protein
LPAPTISKGATLTRLAERQQSDGSAALAPRLSNAANIASMLRASRRTSDSLPDRRIERDNEVSGAASMVKPLKKNTATAPGWIFVKASDRRLQRLLVEILEDIDFKAGFLQLISNSTRASERGGQR